VHPGMRIPRQISRLTGISNALVADAPPITAVLPMLLEVLHGSVLVAHNARFDTAFLNAALRRHDYPELDLPVVCTATLARRLVREEVRNCKLATLCRHFRTHHEPTHRALPDARATVELLHRLLERAAGMGVASLGELLELCQRRDVEAVTQRHRLADGLPTDPGVYAFRSAAGEVLYVGKAVDLRARVRTYFGSDRRRMIRGLLRETSRIDHRVCPTAVEAEVRELRAIARHRPRFNRRSKPPRSAVWLKLTAERFPRLSIVRARRDDGGTYLGPLRSSKEAEQIRDALHDALPLRRCTMAITRRTEAPACALAEIGRCGAPCTGRVPAEAYAPVADQARAALDHGGGTTAPWLVDRMEQLSDGERYHEARWRRDRLRALAEAVLRQRTADALAGVALAAARPAGPGAVTVVRLVDGRLTGSAACAEGEAIRVAHGLPTTAPDGGDPFAVAAERALLARWLTSGGTRLLWAEGAYAQPVAGGLLLDDVVSRIRRRRTTDRAADELYDKRLRRRSA
jgi:DNA polymerase-3 subunit epsilon